MKKEPIDINELECWLDDNWNLYASRNGIKFWISMNRDIEVTKKGDILYNGDDISKAVDIFNQNI